MSAGSKWRPADIAALVLVLVAVARMAMTYRVFSATSDEPMHVSAGLQLLSEHRYALQLNNPPLPRIVLAYPAWRSGMEFNPATSLSQQIEGVFHTGTGNYRRNLVLVRAPNLVFFLIAAAALWWWARREIGPLGAALTLLMFTTQPLVLGHFALATHEGASVAGFAVSLLAFWRWLDRPVLKRAVIAGVALGFSICCKYSNVAFVPAAWLAIYATRWMYDHALRQSWRAHAKNTPAVIIVTAFVIWAGFGFTARYFLAGVATIIEVDRLGHLAYLLGELRERGWWYYFPLAVFFKTTIATLVLVLAGAVVTRDSGTRRRLYMASLAGMLAPLAVSMAGHLDVGVRYVLPIYVPMSLAAGAALLSIFEGARKWARVGALILLTWHLAVTSFAHPAYFPYFNELAGRDPSRILIDSNLDWGQDALRLRSVLRREKIDLISTSLMGPHDLEALGFPPHRKASPWVPREGWLAISDHPYRIDRAVGGWWWLENRPFRRIGASIRLYEIKPPIQ